MAAIYPSWIELPVEDMSRAVTFYRSVFDLDAVEIYNEPTMEIALLQPSEKEQRVPGLSLVRSVHHRPSGGGAVVNFHVGTHEALQQAIARATSHGSRLIHPLIEMEDGVQYVMLFDSEGNPIALSAYEPHE